MKYTCFWLFFCLFYLNSLCSQNIRLLTQADVDAIDFDGYAGINLTIGPDSCCSDIHDLAPLANLTGVYYGKLIIRNNPRLKSLHGLENCKTLGFFPWLEINNNDSLVNVQGLAPEMFVDAEFPEKGHHVEVKNNALLESLQGFPTLDKERPTIFLTGNPRLKSLKGLGVRKQIGWLTIMQSFELDSLAGLEQVDSITLMQVVDCPRLKNLNGLANLEYLASVQFSRLDSLESTTGMNELRELGDMEIRDCPNLQKIESLQKIRGTVQYLWLQHCHRLSDFSGWSDSCTVKTFTYYDNDSIMEFVNLHRVHAQKTKINACQNLKYINSIPIGVKDTVFGEPSPYLHIGECPNLAYLHHPETIAQPSEWNYFWSYNNARIMDISGLSFIKKNTDLIAVTNSNLMDINGLQNLQETQSLLLNGNHNLSTLSSLKNLRYCADMSLSDNGLINLLGMDSLNTIKRIGISYDTHINLTLLHYKMTTFEKKLFNAL